MKESCSNPRYYQQHDKLLKTCRLPDKSHGTDRENGSDNYQKRPSDPVSEVAERWLYQGIGRNAKRPQKTGHGERKVQPVNQKR